MGIRGSMSSSFSPWPYTIGLLETCLDKWVSISVNQFKIQKNANGYFEAILLREGFPAASFLSLLHPLPAVNLSK